MILKKILIASKKESIISHLRNIFADEYDCFIAFSKEEALCLLENHKFDFEVVFISDEINYVGLVQIIKKANEEFCPVIALLNTHNEYQASFLSLNVKDIITAPLEEPMIKVRTINCIKSQRYENAVESNPIYYRIDNKVQENLYLEEIKKLPFDLTCDLNALVLFEGYRVVDPRNYKIYFWNDNEFEETNLKCYQIWNRDVPCKNCISKTACAKNQLSIKIEHLNDEAYLIFAVPIVVAGEKLSIELVKNVTSDLSLTCINNENVNLLNIIKNYDNAISRENYTGLFNKAYMNNLLDILIKANKNFSIILFDINKFKIINDTYGHVAGDIVITKIGEYLHKIDEKYNTKSGRIGGDEFLIIATGDTDIYEVNDTLKKHITNTAIKINDNEFYINIASGIAEAVNGLTRDDILNIADQNMYAEKRMLKK